MFDISFQTKLKLRRKWRNKTEKNYVLLVIQTPSQAQFPSFKPDESGVLCVISKTKYAHYFAIDSLTMNSYLMMTVTWMSMTACSYQFKKKEQHASS